MAPRGAPPNPFLPGNKLGGRKPGSRQAVATRFFNDLHDLWKEQGEAVLRRAAFEKPMDFASMVAKLMPQKLEITTPTDGLSDDRIEALIALAERMAALKAGVSPSMTIEGTAVLIEGEGGSPRSGDMRGEVVDVTPYTTDNPKHLLDVPPPAPTKLSSLKAETVYDDLSPTPGQTATEPAELQTDSRKHIPKIGPGEIPTTKISSLKPVATDPDEEIDPATLF
jgi:hypothetical protein